MAGHSKWANIKFRKGAQDAKRGKVFTKLIREITTAARIGGGDASSNPRLRAALIAARDKNMPKDTMEKAVKRGTGELEGVNYEEIRYEGYGPGGVAVIVETLTDNTNRTVGEVRHLFSKYGGNLGTTGCVGFLFDKVGRIVYQGIDEDILMEAALDAGAEDIESDGEDQEVLSPPEAFEALRESLVKAFGNPVSAEITMRPQNTVALNEKQATSMLKLMELLEDNDDVQQVHANFDISEDILEKLAMA
ncbi:MAG: YebC/PmpR family DNA-binding transcriptional regulator [Magnetococcales bacterium]|nr:YebC/PmpR family DNA-binding transcriptional regulator [Magnetococcales bacterium]